MSGFEAYEVAFLQVTKGINSRISDLATYTSDYDAATAAIRKLDLEIKEAKQNLDQMKLCIGSVPVPARPAYTAKVKQYQEVLSSASGDVEKAKRTALVGSGRTSGDTAVNITASASDRQRVMATTDRMAGSNALLQGAVATLADAEETGGVILTQLDADREKLTRIAGKVEHVSQGTSAARQIVGQMLRKETRIKLFMAFFIILILVLIIVMIVVLSKKSSSSTS